MSQNSAGRTCMVQGRIIWTSGDLFTGKPKLDFNTKQPKINAAGEQMMEYGFGLAVPKSVLDQTAEGQPGEIWAAVHQEALSLYPSGQLPPGFAMKFKDGDGVDHNGKSFAERAGYAGHIIFTCTTSIAIKYFKFENNANIMINEGIKCGDYVNVQLQIKAHGAVGQGKPGLYLNPNAVQFLGFGEAIINAPSGDQIFGASTPPVMGSATPLAPQGQAQIVAAPVAAAPAPVAVPAAIAAPVAAAQPHHAVLPPTMQPVAAPVAVQQFAPQTAQAAVAPVMPAMPGVPQ